MKITLYTVNDCQFSQQERDYLNSHQLQFEEKNLELNKEFLTEMLAVSDNFAGTPVTKIEKDDGSSMVLKGFTQSDFDEALGFKAAEPAVEQKDAAPAPPGVIDPLSPPPASVAPPLSTPDLSGIPPVPSVVNPTNDVVNIQPPTVSTSAPSVAPPVVEPPTQLTQDPTQPMTPAITPTETPVVEPPKAPPDPKLASILGNLQSMSTTPATDQPTAEKPATVSSGMPSVPDPNFG